MSTLNSPVINCVDISNSSGTVALTIDNANRVRRRNQPLFYGWRDTGTPSWETFATITIYNINIAQVNRGSHYNTSTGTWTCPMSGVYLIHAGYLGGNTGNFSSLYVYKNGINQTANGVHHNVGNYWKTNSQTFALNCAQNDLITLRINTGGTTVYSVGHSHCTIWFYG